MTMVTHTELAQVGKDPLEVFSKYESNVRSYCRSFPAVFSKAQGSVLEDVLGRRYVDFFAGAGALNYGHNHPLLKERLVSYLSSDGVIHSLDMATEAKEDFVRSFEGLILRPRNMNYRFQFPGPTGTNAVEAALKLARKVTGRHVVVSFTNGFHGVTLGALGVTAGSYFRKGAGLPALGTSVMPFDGYLGESVNTMRYLEKALEDPGSGLDRPAAVIVETIQGEGGVNPASFAWLRALEALCRAHDVLLIVDDIQAGCGRTGFFFSFEEAEISPDIVLLSKSLSAFGLPLSLLLMKPEHDVWEPGEHNGTFRGNNLAFVTGALAFEHFWSEARFVADTINKGRQLRNRLEEIAANHSEAGLSARGRGMMQGLDCGSAQLARRVRSLAFERGLLVETAGPRDNVIKCLPPLITSEEELSQGLSLLEASIEEGVRQVRNLDQEERGFAR